MRPARVFMFAGNHWEWHCNTEWFVIDRLEEVVKKSGMENTSDRIRELEDELKTMKEKLEQRPLLRQMAFENDQLKKEIKK